MLWKELHELVQVDAKLSLVPRKIETITDEDLEA